MLIASSCILVQQRLFEKHSHMASSEGQVPLKVNISNVYVQDVFKALITKYFL